MSFNIIVKKYDHYNRALGKHIKSKRHYKEELKKGGYVSWEKGQELKEKYDREHHKDYKELSPKTREFLNSMKQKKDGNGKIKLDQRAIEAMEDMGVNFRKREDIDAFNKEGF